MLLKISRILKFHVSTECSHCSRCHDGTWGKNSVEAWTVRCTEKTWRAMTEQRVTSSEQRSNLMSTVYTGNPEHPLSDWRSTNCTMTRPTCAQVKKILIDLEPNHSFVHIASIWHSRAFDMFRTSESKLRQSKWNLEDLQPSSPTKLKLPSSHDPEGSLFLTASWLNSFHETLSLGRHSKRVLPTSLMPIGHEEFGYGPRRYPPRAL